MDPSFAKRRAFWIWLGLAILVATLAVTFTAAVPLSSDALRHRMIRALSEELDSDVELGDLHLRVFPGLRADGADLRIRRRGMGAYPPLIAITSFHVDASLLGVWRKHVDRVQLDGLAINIPPSQARDRQKKLEARSQKVDVKTDGVVIDRLETNDAQLTILPFEPHKTPKVWAIHQLHMRDVGTTSPWPFDATLTNGVPPGEIDVDGRFGPWHRDEPGETPLDGAFNFARADLSVFKGIGGTLSSQGYFDGSLAKLDADGATDTPDFTIAIGGHPFPLHVQYHALIDGTNGDTRLNQIDAWFLNSSLHATGAVLDAPKGRHGRTVTLDVAMDQSRIEDILKMVMHAPTPPMVGALELHTTFVLPPGENDIVDRLRLNGRFSIAQATFTSFDVQGKIDELSKRGRGKAGELAKPRVVSDFRGRFTLAEGRVALPELSFAVPGATVELAGAYTLKPEALDFKGELLLDAKISQLTTGFTSLLLKAVDPLFRRKGAPGSAIPIKVGGSPGAPDVGLDVRRVFRHED